MDGLQDSFRNFADCLAYACFPAGFLAGFHAGFLQAASDFRRIREKSSCHIYGLTSGGYERSLHDKWAACRIVSETLRSSWLMPCSLPDCPALPACFARARTEVRDRGLLLPGSLLQNRSASWDRVVSHQDTLSRSRTAGAGALCLSLPERSLSALVLSALSLSALSLAEQVPALRLPEQVLPARRALEALGCLARMLLARIFPVRARHRHPGQHEQLEQPGQ